jgi:hypothetical protein
MSTQFPQLAYLQYIGSEDYQEVASSPSTTSPIFPLELLHEIVLRLAFSRHELAHGHKPYVLQTLYNLCLCNHALYQITMPYLYSTVILSTAHQLRLFHRTLTTFPPDIRRQTISLSLDDFSSALSPPSSIFLIELIQGMSGHLRRLVFARKSNRDMPALRRALENCRYLEEFSSTRVHGDNPSMLVCWPNWRSLRRLALHHPLVDDEFVRLVSQLPHLTHLVLDEPDWWGNHQPPRTGYKLLAGNTTLERLIVINRVRWDFDEILAQELSVTKKSTVYLAMEVIHIELHAMSIGITIACQRWLRGNIHAGTLWEL